MKSFHSDKIDKINEFEEKVKKRKGKRELLFLNKTNKEKLKKDIVTSKQLKTTKNDEKVEKLPDNNLLKCLTCSFTTNKTRSLQIHTQAVHQKLMRYQCGMCDLRTFYIRTIKKHIMAEHKNMNQENPYFVLTCTLCFEEVDHKEHSYNLTKYKEWKQNYME